jgi:hypothetical protein
MHKSFTISGQIFAQSLFFLSSHQSQFQVGSLHKASSSLVPNNHSFRSRQRNHLLAQGQTQGSMLQQRTNKTLTTGPFDNTYEADEVSPEVEVGVVAGVQCLEP